MDFLDAAPDVPPIPTRSAQRNQPQHHHQYHARRRSSFQDSNSNPHKRASLPPASPEVISNLITSLSAISQPANNHFEAPTSISSSSGFGLGLSAPTSPGSFGVDYGAFSQPSFSLSDLGRDPVSLDDLAASPPVIRTAKPPSGYSTLTAPKSPRSPRSPSRESSGGLRSFIRNSTSRPSSKGSQTSKNDDAQSIGNLSVERGPGHTPELKRQRSHDSWGKKTSRSHKGLMYMSSRERLRERDLERKRSSGGGPTSGGAGLASGGGANGSNHSAGRPDPFLAETAIHEEEPTMANESSGPMDGPRPIPARDSSLRKTGSNAKRSSARRSKRDSDLSDAIPEDDELGKPRDTARRKNRNSSSENRRTSETRRTSAKSSSYGNTLDYLSAGSATSKRPKEGNRTEDFGLGATEDDLDEDGAPFPAVAQGRRRDECKEDRANRRRSGRWSPGPETALNPKRSSSRLKRLSAPLNSPKPDHGGSRDPSQERERERPRNSVPSGYERPQSADSIDDAVESYLCSPRLSQKIKHPQTGRVISFSEVGDSEGSAVFCCVGMGLTRYITAFYDELALTLKLRLITPDRPGVGDSEAYSDGTATPLSWPDDVYAICQALKITKFSILAHSAGAIYALATALRMPQHIRGRIHLLAPWIPPSQMNVFGTSQQLPPTNAIPTSQRILRALPTPILKAANSSFMTATSSSITSSLPKNPRRSKRKNNNNNNNHNNSSNNRDSQASGLPDKENINSFQDNLEKHAPRANSELEATESMDRIIPANGNNPNNPRITGDSAILAAAADAMADKERQVTYDLRLTHAIWELATTGANPAVDLLVCLERRHTIGFRYVDITRPVVIHHGSRDTRVPVDNVKWLGKTMRRCEVRVLEGEGHGLMASAAVMGGVLMEMSKEWEDWMRVTGGGGDGRKERGRRGTLSGR